ncbi:hypothetical protein POL68_32125 [Stigmatella sp. ncwal1]|uniref:Uncharacterized protein n=1 Tax=Stigmatella ashevillensis TaxID=2995309 RepID=A0ABT5DHQ8_9BACT|nr:hypothetical protein [Stigmatella ashevillena]MDC0713153.1 hypothetical protein [Stigmatella ashevillena]
MADQRQDSGILWHLAQEALTHCRIGNALDAGTQALGLSLGTVSKRLYDARAKLHKLLLPYVCPGMG